MDTRSGPHWTKLDRTGQVDPGKAWTVDASLNSCLSSTPLSTPSTSSVVQFGPAWSTSTSTPSTSTPSSTSTASSPTECNNSSIWRRVRCFCRYNITVYDADIVAEHNLPNQLFHFEQVGIPKVDAIANTVYYQAQVDLNAIPRHYTRENLSGLVICCVDTMDTRLEIWREVKKFKPDLYIDARMGAEVGKVLVVQPSDPNSRRKYEEDLYPSSEAFQAPCTAKATVYCAAGLAAYICSMVARYVNGRKVEGLVVDWVT